MCPLLPHIFCPAAAGCARKKPREHTAPGADGDAVCVPAHWPMSWQYRMMMAEACARVALPCGAR